MKSLLEPETLGEILERVQKLEAGSTARWGRMSVAQMLTHCRLILEVATGQTRPPRALVGRLFGWLLPSDAPMRHNMPTIPMLRVTEPRRFDEEKTRLVAVLRAFGEGGPEGVTTHPHPFYGHMTPQQWGVQQYLHLDHHLEQFGV